MRKAHVGPYVASDDHVLTWRERALPVGEANCHLGRLRPAHAANLSVGARACV